MSLYPTPLPIAWGDVDASAGAVERLFQFTNKGRRLLEGVDVSIPAGQAAHSTSTVNVTVTNRGSDGAGTTIVALITNDSDDASDDTTLEQAYAANVPSYLDLTSDNALVAAIAGKENISGTQLEDGDIIEVKLNVANTLTVVDIGTTLYLMEGQN